MRGLRNILIGTALLLTATPAAAQDGGMVEIVRTLDATTHLGPDGAGLSAGAGISGAVSAPGVSLKGSLSGRFDASVTRGGDAGCGMATVHVDASVKANASAGVNAPKAGATVRLATGASVDYTATVPDAEAAALLAGRALPPTPFDLSSLPAGSSVEMRASDFHALGLDVAFRSFAGSATTTATSGYVVSVVRVDATHVRVTAGPESDVKLDESYALGAIGATSSKRVAGSTTKSWDFDLSTQSGADAYDALITRGEAPATAGTKTSTMTVSQSGGAFAALDGTKLLDIPVASGDVTTTVTDSNDGTSTKTVEGNVMGSRFTVSGRFTRDASGNTTAVPGTLSVAVQAPRLSSTDLEDLRAATGASLADVAASRPATLTFRGDEWKSFRDAMAAKCGAFGTCSRFAKAVAGARTPTEFALYLARWADQDGSGLFETMATAALDHPGTRFPVAVSSPAAPSCPAAPAADGTLLVAEVGGSNLARSMETRPASFASRVADVTRHAGVAH